MRLPTAMDVQDIARLLVVPSSRRPVPPAQLAAFHARLAPIEMSAPSLHLAAPQRPAKAVPGPEDVESGAPPAGREVPVYLIPACYVCAGLVLCVCNAVMPDALAAVAHLVVPVWTVGLGLHSLAEPDRAWAWLGVLCGLFTPAVLLLRDPLFVGLYLILFAAFASGRFWQVLHGPAFALVCVCWFGLAAACVSCLFAQHPRAQLSVAACFALTAGIVSSAIRFGRMRLAVS